MAGIRSTGLLLEHAVAETLQKMYVHSESLTYQRVDREGIKKLFSIDVVGYPMTQPTGLIHRYLIECKDEPNSAWVFSGLDRLTAASIRPERRAPRVPALFELAGANLTNDAWHAFHADIPIVQRFAVLGKKDEDGLNSVTRALGQLRFAFARTVEEFLGAQEKWVTVVLPIIVTTASLWLIRRGTEPVEAELEEVADRIGIAVVENRPDAELYDYTLEALRRLPDATKTRSRRAPEGSLGLLDLRETRRVLCTVAADMVRSRPLRELRRVAAQASQHHVRGLPRRRNLRARLGLTAIALFKGGSRSDARTVETHRRRRGVLQVARSTS